MKETEFEKNLASNASCRLRDEEEVKEEREWRKEKEREKKDGRTEMERSNISDRTNYRNIREPVSAESISSHSTSSSPLFPSLAVSFTLHLSSLFFFPFILRSQWGYYWWGTSCTKFSFSVQLLSLTTLGEPWSIRGLIVSYLTNSKLQCNSFLCLLVTKQTTESYIGCVMHGAMNRVEEVETTKKLVVCQPPMNLKEEEEEETKWMKTHWCVWSTSCYLG